MAKSWDDITPQTGQSDKFKLGEHVGVIDKDKIASNKDKGKYFQFRFHGPVSSFEQAWIPLYKDGQPVMASKGRNVGKAVEIPKMVISYNPDTEGYNEDPNNPDPVLDLVHKMNEVLPSEERVKIQRTYLGNCIHRMYQRAMPKHLPPMTPEEQETGFKSLDSESWTANYIWPMPGGMADKIKNLKQLNQVRHPKTGEMVEFSVGHDRFGCDVNIKYVPTASPTAMYDIQKGERTPLTEAERAMLIWDVDVVQKYIETTVDINALANDMDRMARQFFANRRGASGGASRRRQLIDDDMPADLAEQPARGRGRQAAAPVADEFGADDVPFDDVDGGFADDFGGGGDFVAADDGGDFVDDAGGDFDAGGDDFGDDFTQPAPVQTRRAAPQQNRSRQQAAAPQQRGRGAPPPMDDGFADLDGIDDTNEFGDDGGDGDVDFAADDSGFGPADDDEFAPPPQPARRQQTQQRPPQQNRQAAPPQRQQQQRPTQQQRPQQQRPVQQPTQQNRRPAPTGLAPVGRQAAPPQRPTQQQRPPQGRGPAAPPQQPRRR